MPRIDQPARDMAEYTLEKLNISTQLWLASDLERVGRDLLGYAALLLIAEEGQNAERKS